MENSIPMPLTPYNHYNKGELTQLLDIAREAIRSHLFDDPSGIPELDLYTKKMRLPTACFVTLEVAGQLQGSIGTTRPTLPLVLEVHNKAISSAYEDRRFMPLAEEQLDTLTIEVSVLSQLERLKCEDEASLIDYLSQHQIGVQLTFDHKQAIMLPQAWCHYTTPSKFIQMLKLKAGLAMNFWHPDIVIEIFTVDSLKEKYNSIRGQYF
ncbi:TPA: AmmeMemoRadiSam system protein A [Photobacterium damselae]